MLSKIRSHKGFTLIELMIVVAIIGILAAIAIPNFMRFQMKAKKSEAKSIIGSIRTTQEAFKAENGGFANTTANPASFTKNAKTAWVTPVDGDGWYEIGIGNMGMVYFQYQVVTTTENPAITFTTPGGNTVALGLEMLIGARQDLDNNDTNAEVAFASDTTKLSKGGVITIAATVDGEVRDLNPGEF
jgi:type IV pilus assembly protein PilA